MRRGKHAEIHMESHTTKKGPETQDLLAAHMRMRAYALSCGDRIRTYDLEVMSLASYRTAPPRVNVCLVIYLYFKPFDIVGKAYPVIRSWRELL